MTSEDRAGSFQKLISFLSGEIALQRERAILFVPVIMACGIGVYFGLYHEPAALLGLLSFSSLALLYVLLRQSHFRFVVLACCLVALGFSAAQIRSHLVYTPILEREIDFARVEGVVKSIEGLDKGARVILSDLAIEKVSQDNTPRLVRLKLWRDEMLQVGQRVSVLANLKPPSDPVLPGGFDFRRHMYFKGIGAVGFIYKQPEILDQPNGGTGALTSSFFDGVRHKVDVRIDTAMGAGAGLAKALMVGERGAIKNSDLEAIRHSGLAHMLAISGLHVGLFSGFLFFVSRFVMALFPSFALRYPIKKYAAVFAFVGAVFYTMLAGATIPTQRALISVAVIFGAILLDRSPISLRVVAFAAFVVLLFFPESLTSASFQMSFAAVTALVAFYEWINPVWSRWYRQAGIVRRCALYFAGVSITTVVASLATAPFALFHFQQFASYGLLANFVCVPVLAFLVMPGAILALLLMPFGIEKLGFAIMQPGLDLILKVAHVVSDIQGAVIHLPAADFSALLLCILIVLSAVLLRGNMRFIFVAIFVVLIPFNLQVKQRDILISSDFDLVALKGHEPFLHLSSRGKERFTRDVWERSMGLGDMRSLPFEKEGRYQDERLWSRCDEKACRFEIDGVKAAYLRVADDDVLMQECIWADIVLAQHVRDPGKRCQARYFLNKYDVYRHGAHVINIRDGAVSFERVNDFNGPRLWRSD